MNTQNVKSINTVERIKERLSIEAINNSNRYELIKQAAEKIQNR